MAIYTWDNTSPLTQVDIATQKKGASAAVIRLPETIAQEHKEQLATLPDRLREQGLAVIADSQDGTPILRIANIKSPDALLNTLRDSGTVAGEATVEDGKNKLSLKEKWKNNTGKIAGYTYLGGDLFMSAGGVARETEGLKSKPDWNGWKKILKGQFSTGWLWLLGGLGLGRYANEAAARKQERLLHSTAEFFETESIDVPEHSILHAQETKTPRTGFKKFEDFMFRFPTEFLNFFFAVGSVFLIKAGWNKNPNTNERNWGKFGSGVLVFLGAINGMLFKPKKADEGKERGFFGNLWNKIRANPLILTSAAYISNNVTGAVGAYVEKKQINKLLEEITPKLKNNAGDLTHKWDGAKEDRPTYGDQHKKIMSSRAYPMFDYGVYAFYGVANAALMMTKKTGGHGGSAGGDDVSNTVYAAAAEVMTGLTEEKREEMLPKLAEHLRKARGLSPFAEDIEAALREKVKALKSHPMMTNLSAPASARADALSSPSLEGEGHSSHLPGSTDKVTEKPRLTHREAVTASRQADIISDPVLAV